MILSHKKQLEQFSLAPQQQASGLTTEQMNQLKADYMKAQLQIQLAQQQARPGQFIQVDSLDSLSYAQPPIPIEVPQHNLNEGAWDVPISQLVDLWVVKYGNKWVNSEELDEFYEVAARRLRALNKLETHYVNSTDVFRVVE